MDWLAADFVTDLTDGLLLRKRVKIVIARGGG